MSEADVRGAPEAHGNAEHAPATGRRTHGAHPSPKEYIRIAIVLFLITIMEVSTYYLQPPRSVLIPVLFVFTVVKFSLVDWRPVLEIKTAAGPDPVVIAR